MPDTWLREHPNPSLEEVAAEVSRLHKVAEGQRRASRTALAALVLALILAGVSLTWANRVADHAKANAVAEAEKARKDAFEGLCGLIGDFIRADNPQRDARLRAALRETYTDPKCVPPLDANGKLPPLPPTPAPTVAPTTRPPTPPATDEPTDPPAGN